MKKKTFTQLMIFWVFMIGFIMNPVVNSQGSTLNAENLNFDNKLPQSSLLNKNIPRVAIYDESNTTKPNYVTAGNLNNNASQMWSMLESSGCDVTLLSTNDIYNHALLTSNFDVFILPDNVPRENITNYVTEFWLGGGSILGFDSAASYLCYFGILPIESTGDDGFNNYWAYMYHNITISSRHPVSISYDIDDHINLPYDYAVWNWTKLQTTSVADDLYRIGRANDHAEFSSVIALDPTTRGGKVVTISYDYSTIEIPALDQLIVDALDWLVPHPKGRVLYDLTHQSYTGIDSWDSLTVESGRYANYRNELVNCKYLVDKLYPSASGNLTSENLADYDILIVNFPELNFSASETSVVGDWVNSGGGLFILGDISDYIGGIHDYNLNYLLSPFDLSFFMGYNGVGPIDEYIEHPTTERCTSISMLSMGLINFTGDAYPIWGNNGGDYMIGAQEYGSGRIIVASDIYFLYNSQLGDVDNEQFGINVANWLTSDNARVLLYTDSPFYNYYQSPEALALNELEISFHLTFNIVYFNLSLYRESWDLVIFNDMNFYVSSYFDDILTYIESGGNLIFCSFDFESTNGFELWDYLGFEYGEQKIYSPPEIYLWDLENTLFNYPIGYNALAFSTVEAGFGIDYCSLIPHENGTAIAGISPFFKDNNSAIILGANGRAISNGMLLSNYQQDSDDSTYSDALEIWINEIAYLMFPPQAPIILTEDQTISANQTSIAWIEVQNADSYKIYIENNGTTEVSASGFEHILEFSGNGTYLISMTALNENGESVRSNEIIIIVEITEDGTSSEGLEGLLDSLSDPNTLIWMGITGGGVLLFTLIIPGIIKLLKKKKGKKKN